MLIATVILSVWVSSAAGESTSLHGVWNFRLDPNSIGEKESWHNQVLSDQITLPSTTDEAGYGGKTNGIESGYLSRVHMYIGPAWYQREIEIPQSWQDQKVELLLERVLWESKVWIDDRFCDSQDSLGTPHLHRLGQLTPGKHRLTVRVNNAMIHPIGDKGHCYTEHTQTIWNGIVGRVELRAHGPLWIQRLRIFPSNDGTVRIDLTLHNELFHPVSGTITAKILEKSSGRVVATGEVALQIPRGLRPDHTHIIYTTFPAQIMVKLAEKPKLWSEFNPELYQVELQLQATAGETQLTDTATATFGFRTVGRIGQHIVINGRPTFIRGNLDCAQFPLTGYPPCDVEAWRRIFHIYKEHGLNQVRFHSWCPPEAAFQAADELGIYIQAEVLWVDEWMARPNIRATHKTPGRPQGIGKNDRTIDQYVRAEMRRMFDAYGNHPSFVFFVIGNELGSSNYDVMAQWISEEKTRDPRRLYSASTARDIASTDDFSNTHNIPRVGVTVNKLAVPHTDWDYEKSYSRAPVPIIAHEMGQMPVYPCWDEIGKYIGVLRARNLEGFRKQARKNGIETQSRELQQASGASNRIIYKSEMEAQLRSPSCSGVSWLSMQDFPGQGEALVGWLDSFYDSKSIITPVQFRRYSSPTVPLARFKKFVWTNGEKFRALAQLAHWGPQPLNKAVAVWRLLDAENKTIACGEFPPTDFSVGSVTTLGPIEVDLGAIGQASQLNLEIALRGTEFANDWNLWVFPQQTTVKTAADVVVCDRTEAALKALKQGKRVLLLAHRLGAKNNTSYAAWRPLFWSATWFPSRNSETLGALVQNGHPALTGFPTDAHLDWQWYDLCMGARGFILDHLPADYHPIVQPVSDFHFNHKLGSIFEFRTKEGGRLLVCGYNLADNLADRPAAQQLRKSLLDYAESIDFEPKQEITAQRLLKLFLDMSK